MTKNAGKRRGVSEERGRTSGSGVTLWQPGIVLASTTVTTERRPAVRIAEPLHRPESVRARVHTAQSILDSLVGARESLTSRLASAQARAVAAQTERERISATIDAYRLDAALDEVLTATSTQVSLLMKERGLR